MRHTNFGAAVLASLVLTGCMIQAKPPQQSQLQIRQYQTRAYETTDHKKVLKASMHALQDGGFIIKQANSDLGLLTAQKETDVQNDGEALLATLLGGSQARYQKNAIEEASVNVSEFGKKTKVRINIALKVLDHHGGVASVAPVQDAQPYQAFFATLSKSLFLADQKIN